MLQNDILTHNPILAEQYLLDVCKLRCFVADGVHTCVYTMKTQHHSANSQMMFTVQ